MKQMRNTVQKSLIMSIMENNFHHPSADEVYEQARLHDPHISRGTVYRNLNTLAEIGSIKRLSMPIGPDHYDFNIKNHYHFVCRNCNKVFDTDLPYNEHFNEKSPDLPGFVTEWHRLIFVGLCPDCSKS